MDQTKAEPESESHLLSPVRSDGKNQPDDGRLPDEEMEPLFKSHQSALLRYAARMVRDAETAQDVVQEVFLRLHVEPPQGNDPKLLSTWLYRVAHNLCVDLIRKESRMRAQVEELPRPAPIPGPDRAMEAAETRRELDALLGRLNENQRIAVVLKIQEGKSYREISEITGLTVSNVGFLIHQAMKKMNGWLNEAAKGEGT